MSPRTNAAQLAACVFVTSVWSSSGHHDIPPPDDRCDKCYWGWLHHWVVAVVACCCGSFFTVIGFVLQKKALASPHRRWPTVGDIVLSPQWLLGLIVAMALPLPLTAVAYNLAPISLTSPLSGFTIFLNFVLAPWMLGEALHWRIDVLAGVLIVGGCVTTTITGNHGTDTAEVDVERLRGLVLAPVNIAQACVVALVTGGGILYMCQHRDGIQARASERPTNPPMVEVMLPAVMYGLFGSVSNIALAAATHSVSNFGAFAGVLLIAGVAGFCQLNFFNRGLRLYQQVIFFPVGNALLVLSITVVGMIFYEEYEDFEGSPERAVLFGFGILLILLGIYAFRFRKTDVLESGAEGARVLATEPLANPATLATEPLAIGAPCQPWVEASVNIQEEESAVDKGDAPEEIQEIRPVDTDPALMNEEENSAVYKGDAPDTKHCPAPALSHGHDGPKCGVTEAPPRRWSL